MEIDREKLFLENQKLAFHVLHRNFKRLADDEDMKQEALIGLWRACRAFDPEKGCEFSTLAFPCIKNAILQALRRKGREFEADASLDAEPRSIAMRDAYSTATLGDIVEDPHALDEHNAIDANHFLQELPADKRQLVVLKMQGMTQREIAQGCGISQAEVSRRLKRLRSGLREAVREA